MCISCLAKKNSFVVGSLAAQIACILMAQLIEGDSRGLNRGLIGNTSGLPPRFPTLSNRGVFLSDIDNPFPMNQGKVGTLGRNHRQHYRTPSCCIVMQNQPFLPEKPLEEKEISSTRGLHRRCASDSVTYLENSGNFTMFSNIAEEDESECPTALSTEKVTNQAIEDGDQLLDLLEEIQQLQDQQNLPISTRSPSVLHKCDTEFVNTTGNSRVSLENAPGHLVLDYRGRNADDGAYYGPDSSNGDSNDPSENDLDPKKAKRVVANRQSAQRSRVRKLQHIAELERVVSTLQTEVSSLSLQVIYLKHQRALLNMDNNALKQQTVFFVQEKRSKDSQNDILMHDIRRLQKLSDFQSLHKSLQIKKQSQPHQHCNIQRHSSLPSDFVPKTHQSEELNTGFTQAIAESSSFNELMKDFSGMSLDAGLDRERFSVGLDSIRVGTALSTEGNIALGREVSDDKVMTYDT